MNQKESPIKNFYSYKSPYRFIGFPEIRIWDFTYNDKITHHLAALGKSTIITEKEFKVMKNIINRLKEE